MVFQLQTREDTATQDRQARKRTVAEGESHDQGGAEWIVIRRSLWGHDDTPCGRPAPGRPIGRPGSGRPQGVIGVFLVTID
jgi:hypothetical protein